MNVAEITDPFTAILAWRPPPGVRHEIEFPNRSNLPIRVSMSGRSGSRSFAIPATATAQEVTRDLDACANALAGR